jgi:D-alanyl-D-alanine endopeptidase (penicillin-binding protein 7)
VQKTGYTNDAGQCLVMQARLQDRPVVMVLLNSFGTLTRTADARRIRRWLEVEGGPGSATESELAKTSKATM